MPKPAKDVSVPDQLKAKHKRVLERHAEPSRVRLHRAISWFGRAEQESDDMDARFIFLWIAFNAAYAREFGFEQSEREQLRRFFAALLAIDDAGRLHAIALQQFSGAIRTMIENRFVFEPFWKALRGHDSSGHWERQFETSRKVALKSIMDGHTETVLSIVFDRLYVLRNQLIHGGATWNSRVNRAQVKDGVRILSALIPVVIDLMLDHAETDFGPIAFPVI
ncbi:MAG TPA: hypothetical protein VFG55_05875 [Rhodanobacteraceae bacterium]|nr:hypothetical protein [Rhodanobacteraceae bacterium]